VHLVLYFLPPLLFFLISACSSMPVTQKEALAQLRVFAEVQGGDLQIYRTENNLAMQLLFSQHFAPKFVAGSVKGAESRKSAETEKRVVQVYIGGDGQPWLDKGKRIAADPTRFDHTSLALWQKSKQAALFLGRPCYYLEAMPEACSAKLWTSARYSEVVVEAMLDALRSLQKKYAIQAFHLIGYSGGGSLAVLMAARESSITKVVSIAANIPMQQWTEQHAYLPLQDSLNPRLYMPLAKPHLLLLADEDEQVPLSLFKSWLPTWQLEPSFSVSIKAGFDHDCCWDSSSKEIQQFLE